MFYSMVFKEVKMADYKSILFNSRVGQPWLSLNVSHAFFFLQMKTYAEKIACLCLLVVPSTAQNAYRVYTHGGFIKVTLTLQ